MMLAEFMFYRTKEGIDQNIKNIKKVIRHNSKMIEELKMHNVYNRQAISISRSMLKKVKDDH